MNYTSEPAAPFFPASLPCVAFGLESWCGNRKPVLTINGVLVASKFAGITVGANTLNVNGVDFTLTEIKNLVVFSSVAYFDYQSWQYCITFA